MSDTTTAVDPSKLSTTNIIVHQLTLLLTELLIAARATADLAKSIKINSEMMAVQTVLNTAVQAQTAADDDQFSQACQNLNAQAAMLTAMEAQVAAIVADVASAGRIIGYIGQAVALIARL